MVPNNLMTALLLLLVALCNPGPALGFAVPPHSLRETVATSSTTAVPSPSLAILAASSSANGGDENEGKPHAVDRRSALVRAGTDAAALSALLLSSSSISPLPANAVTYDDSKKKRILITGSNSGIGLDAAQRMATRGHDIVLACRTLAKANAAADKIRTNIANDSDDAIDANTLLKSLKLTPMECDLADLASVDAFVKNLKNSGGKQFDAVCYNAGLARNTDAKDVARTRQGFELTVGTNHLGHFYLNALLLGSSMINRDDGRIVVTASSVHDPDSPGGAQGQLATLGGLRGLEDAASDGSGRFDMVDGGTYNGDKAYKDSKLCNVLFARELQRRLDNNGGGGGGPSPPAGLRTSHPTIDNSIERRTIQSKNIVPQWGA
mmetsp:Transcript_38191/g.92129  ORF Transcript_38191/g.92129 Transcript_38191/m.92129 type:complete len:380 (+) Transcript_38191:28-1167(+)